MTSYNSMNPPELPLGLEKPHSPIPLDLFSSAFTGSITSKDEMVRGVKSLMKEVICQHILKFKADIENQMDLKTVENSLKMKMGELQAMKANLVAASDDITRAQKNNRLDLVVIHEKRKVIMLETVNQQMLAIYETEKNITDLKQKWESYRINFKEEFLKAVVKKHNQAALFEDTVTWKNFMPVIKVPSKSENSKDGKQKGSSCSYSVVKYFE